MDPQVIGADQWAQISRALIYLFLFTGLGLTSAMGFLLGHAVVPSLIDSRDAPAVVGALRWLAYPVSVAAIALAVYALLRGLLLVTSIAQQIYPRGWI
jgi:hypothetical protein